MTHAVVLVGGLNRNNTQKTKNGYNATGGIIVYFLIYHVVY